MKSTISVAVILATFLSVVHCQYQYDCRRMDDCKNSGTCEKDNCTCIGDFSGYNCAHNTTSANCIDDICENGGICYKNGTTDVCACPYGFYGSTCQSESVNITCDGNKAEFVMAISEDFIGTVKLEAKNGIAPSAECNMTQVTVDDMNTYSLAVDLTDDNSNDEALCKLANIEKVTDEAGPISYTAIFLVNYVTDVTTSLDELYTLTCTHDMYSGMELYTDITNIGVVNENLTVVDFNETYSPVDLTVLDNTGNILTKDLFVGDAFMLFVYLTDELAYSDVFIENCTANNTLENAESKTFTVLENGCPTKQSKRVVSEQTDATYDVTLVEGAQAQSVNGKQLLIQAFKFHDSTNIGILCTAKICKAGDITCAPPTNCVDIINQEGAVADGEYVGRKRRAADDDEETVEETVSAVITVLTPGTYKSSKTTGTQTVDTVQTCLAPTEITAVVSVLGAVVFVLLIVCFFLACLILARRNEAANKFDFDRLSQPKADRFHIPRAHVNESFREL